MLHFIERVVRVHFPDLCGFVDDLQAVRNVATLSIDSLQHDVKEFKDCVRETKFAIEKGDLNDPAKLHKEDHILEVIKPMLVNAQRKLDVLEFKETSVLKRLKQAMVYYGEDPEREADVNAFFKSFADFLKDFMLVHGENIRQEEAEKVNEMKMRELEKHRALVQRHKMEMKKKRASMPPEDPESNASVEQLLAKLRSTKTRAPSVKKYKDTINSKSGGSGDEHTEAIKSNAHKMLQQLKDSDTADSSIDSTDPSDKSHADSNGSVVIHSKPSLSPVKAGSPKKPLSPMKSVKEDQELSDDEEEAIDGDNEEEEEVPVPQLLDEQNFTGHDSLFSSTRNNRLSLNSMQLLTLLINPKLGSPTKDEFLDNSSLLSKDYENIDEGDKPTDDNVTIMQTTSPLKLPALIEDE
ncbi:unnamed protein product [Ambrosiozyma monospora]|uniref:Unnamed protein product n=1 Tax=Ambrosiozyma monospora TaxID=43982 RepID=A0ACB5SVI7_AMBMO|nr:unnamed protein product [Ambrosiozyma monospora]